MRRSSPLFLVVAALVMLLAASAAAQTDQQINLNTASEAALGSIPGMPAHIAVLIVKYREEYGAFTEVRDLLKVPGVTREIYDRASPRLAIKPSMPPPAPAATPTPAPPTVLIEVPPTIRPTAAPGTTVIAAAPAIRTLPPAPPQPAIRTAPPAETGPHGIVITGTAPPPAEPVIRVEAPAPQPSTSPFTAEPRLRSARHEEAPAELPVVETRYETPEPPRLTAFQSGKHTLALDVETTEVKWNTPFPIVLRAYDEMGLPAASFNAPVTFECMNGVAPILSSARWSNGHLFDTIIIARPGRNVRLTAIAGDAIAAIHLDVAASAPDRAIWIRQADEFLAVGKFEEGIYALEKAAAMTAEEDAAGIERRIARLYLERGMWTEAEAHYQKALRAITR